MRQPATIVMSLALMWLGAWHIAAVEPTAESPAAQGWATEVVAEGLEHPWALCFLPNGDMLVTERPGRLRLVTSQGLHPDPIAGVPDVLVHRQGGLLDVEIDPDFATNRWVYLSYASGTRQANATTIARGRLDGHALHDVTVIYQVEPSKRNGFHFGSRMGFLRDGTLVFSIGDGGMRQHARDLGLPFGKLLRIRPDGSPATDNPFHARVDSLQELYSSGHRNIQGLTVHPETGAIWVTEHGPKGGDELNLIQPGADYGWPTYTYGEEYRGGAIGDGMTHADGTIAPTVVWTPSIATSGLTVYTGNAIPSWTGDFFAGGLVLRQVRRIMVTDGVITGQETLQFDQRIRDVANGPDEHLYVATDEVRGQILRIIAAE